MDFQNLIYLSFINLKTDNTNKKKRNCFSFLFEYQYSITQTNYSKFRALKFLLKLPSIEYSILEVVITSLEVSTVDTNQNCDWDYMYKKVSKRKQTCQNQDFLNISYFRTRLSTISSNCWSSQKIWQVAKNSKGLNNNLLFSMKPQHF
jgi:hypothetical protein